MTEPRATGVPRGPATGPCIILDLPALWVAVEDEMERRGLTEIKQLSEITGIDRNTLGRARRRAHDGILTRGQRGGLNVNAYLSLATFAANGSTAAHGHEEHGGILHHVRHPADDTSPAVTDTAG